MTEVAFSCVEEERKAAPGGPNGRSTGLGCGGPVGLAAAGLRRLWPEEAVASGHPLRRMWGGSGAGLMVQAAGGRAEGQAWWGRVGVLAQPFPEGLNPGAVCST